MLVPSRTNVGYTVLYSYIFFGDYFNNGDGILFCISNDTIDCVTIVCNYAHSLILGTAMMSKLTMSSPWLAFCDSISIASAVPCHSKLHWSFQIMLEKLGMSSSWWWSPDDLIKVSLMYTVSDYHGEQVMSMLDDMCNSLWGHLMIVLLCIITITNRSMWQCGNVTGMFVYTFLLCFCSYCTKFC